MKRERGCSGIEIKQKKYRVRTVEPHKEMTTMGCRSFSTFRYCCVIIALVVHVPGGCYYQQVAAFTTSTSSSSTAAATNGRARNQNHRYRGMYKNVHHKSNVFHKNDDEKEVKDHRKSSSSSSSSPWKLQLKNAYDRRVNADPSFFSKSITEIIVAAGTQLMAELNRRGVSRIIPELDFVLPAIFAAIFGKYYRYVLSSFAYLQ